MAEYLTRRAELIAALNSDTDKAKEYLKNVEKTKKPEFVTFINDYICSNGIQRSFIIREANLNPQYGYKILNGNKHTSNRNIILRICIAMKMGYDETQNALMIYDMCPLDQTVFRDEIIGYGIGEKLSIYGIDIWLRKAGEKPLIEDCP